jgi:hypothetical protein
MQQTNKCRSIKYALSYITIQRHVSVDSVYIILLHIIDILVWHPDDGRRSDRDMSVNNNIWRSILSMRFAGVT